MKIFELFNQSKEESGLDFDLQDDLIFFMNNDPDFYRKEFHPFLTKYNRHCDAGRQVSPKAFFPIVKKAYEEYQSKFQVEKLDADLSEDTLTGICEVLNGQCMQNYQEEKKKKNDES
jgi:hypothetical protein